MISDRAREALAEYDEGETEEKILRLLLELEEKADKYDDISKHMDFTSFIVMKEKVAKYDEMLTINSWAKVDELKKKAANWDMLERLPKYCYIYKTEEPTELRYTWCLEYGNPIYRAALFYGHTPAEALKKYWDSKQLSSD